MAGRRRGVSNGHRLHHGGCGVVKAQGAAQTDQGGIGDGRRCGNGLKVGPRANAQLQGITRRKTRVAIQHHRGCTRSCTHQQTRLRRGCQIGRHQLAAGGNGGRRVEHAGDVQALATVGEKTFHAVRQKVVAWVVLRAQALAKPALEFAPAGDQGGHAHGATFGDADKTRGAGADTFNGLGAGINFFDINRWG